MKKVINGQVRLRKMTAKSTLEEGRYAFMKVGDLMKEVEHITYLVNIYFRYDNLSFTDEVLDQLGVTEEYRIEKPGSNRVRFYDWKMQFLDTDEKRLRHYNDKQRDLKQYRKSMSKADNFRFTKQNMRDRNHGK
jgi:hypothetical protein